MTPAHLAVEDGGVFSTLQDGGRFGWQRYGIAPAGAMDRPLFALANALAGNLAGTAVVETTLSGPLVRVEGGACRIAVAGRVRLFVDEAPVEPFRAHDLRPGQTLRVGAAIDGMRAYLAVTGGFDLPPVLGSLSTHTRSGLGGLEGRALRAGDRLPLRAPAASGPCLTLPSAARADVPAGPIRVVLGPQADAFTPRGLETFLAFPYTLSTRADRMGCQFDGPAVEHRDGFNIVSDGIVDGSIQVPGNGRPIVLLADRQTTGGYPKIATVIGADLPRLAQLRPGDAVRFTAIDPDAATDAARAAAARLQRMLGALAPARLDAASLTSAELLSRNLVGGVVSALEFGEAEASDPARPLPRTAT